MVDIAPLFRECLALLTIDELEKAEKVFQTGISVAARQAVTEIQAEKIKRTKNA